MSEGSKSLLIIDSEPSWLEFCELTLRRNGYEVYTASTGWAAEELLTTHFGSSVALVLIDIKSLEQDEMVITTLSRSHNGSRRSVVVVFATELTPNRARVAFKLGASDCVSKPYDETALLALVEQMLADHRISVSRERSFVKSPSTVLVVEDNDDWRTDLVKYLPPVDKVVTAPDYQTAVEIISTQSFGLAVIDLRLVDADDNNFQGMDLVRLIRKKDKECDIFTQIIIVSAFGTPEHIRESYSNFNIYYYFDKRYLSPSKYRDSIKEALNI